MTAALDTSNCNVMGSMHAVVRACASGRLNPSTITHSFTRLLTAAATGMLAACTAMWGWELNRECRRSRVMERSA